MSTTTTEPTTGTIAAEPPAPVAQTAPTPIQAQVPTQSTFEHFFTACHHAAALIYDDVVAGEKIISQWRSDNPQLAALFDQGVTYVSDILLAHGLPVMQGVLVVKTIGAALKMMAAGDPTVVSGTPVVAAVA